MVCSRGFVGTSQTLAERRCPGSRVTPATRRTSSTSSTWASSLVQWATNSCLSSRGHAYLKVVPPWDRFGRKAGGARPDRPINIAIDVEMLVQLGCRLCAPGVGEALVMDWITNKVIIYAYDAECARFIWTNRMYVDLRTYQERLKKFRDDVKGGQNLRPALVAFMETVDRERKGYYRSWAPTACLVNPQMQKHRRREPAEERSIVVGVRDGSLRSLPQLGLRCEAAARGDPWPARSLAGPGPQQEEVQQLALYGGYARSGRSLQRVQRIEPGGLTVFSATPFTSHARREETRSGSRS